MLTEKFLFREVKEVLYDIDDLPLDRNHSGVVWRFCFTADYLTLIKIIIRNEGERMLVASSNAMSKIMASSNAIAMIIVIPVTNRVLV